MPRRTSFHCLFIAAASLASALAAGCGSTPASEPAADVGALDYGPTSDDVATEVM